MSPSGRHYYWKSEYLPGLSDAAIETAISYASRLSSPLTAVLIFQLGGAISRVNESSAAANREAAFVLNIQSSWLEPRESADTFGGRASSGRPCARSRAAGSI